MLGFLNTKDTNSRIIDEKVLAKNWNFCYLKGLIIVFIKLIFFQPGNNDGE
jgi:hypothetical protein